MDVGSDWFGAIKQPLEGTLLFRWPQVQKKGPLQTPLPLIFFWFLISENVDVEILQRGNFEKKIIFAFCNGVIFTRPGGF